MLINYHIHYDITRNCITVLNHLSTDYLNFEKIVRLKILKPLIAKFLDISDFEVIFIFSLFYFKFKNIL